MDIQLCKAEIIMTKLDKTQAVTNESEISLLAGLKFNFYDDDREIIAYSSSFSGKEIIYLNGINISEQRSFKVRSIHQLKVQEDDYEVEFNVTSFLKSKIECTLIKNGVHVKTIKLQVATIKQLMTFILAGFISGAFIGFFTIKIIKTWF